MAINPVKGTKENDNAKQGKKSAGVTSASLEKTHNRGQLETRCRHLKNPPAENRVENENERTKPEEPSEEPHHAITLKSEQIVHDREIEALTQPLCGGR